MTSKAYMDAIRRKLKRYRIELSITQADMASITGLSLASIKNFESGSNISADNLFKILIALNLADKVNDSIPDMDESPIAYIDRKNKKTKQRAHKKSNARKTNFKWGDEQ